MKNKLIISLTGLLLLLCMGVASAQSPQWMSWASDSCELNDLPVPVGAILQAVDNDGVICGEKTFMKAGLYTFMAVYLDNPNSPEDEGCSIGESIDFYINGIQATELGPDDDIWSEFGATKLMKLSVQQTFGVSVDGADDGQGEAGTVVDYTVFVNNEGNGTDLFSFSATSDKGWAVSHDAPLGGFYLLAGESLEVTVSVTIPVGATVGEEDDLTVTATSQFEGTNSGSKMITTKVDNLTSVDENDYVIPGEFRLQQNYPNPFNPETNIAFNLEKSGHVNLEVYDILGRKQATLFDGVLGAGEHTFTWHGIDANGRQASSGIYFYRLSSDGYSLTRKMTLLK